MNTKPLRRVGEELLAWSNDPPGDLDHLVFICEQRLKEWREQHRLEAGE